MRSRFSSYAWSVLAFHLAVILWGAFVRASGSGAGCGEHWPLCNGQIVPRAPVNATLIEFGHRATSGIALVSVLVLAVWAFRAFPRGYGVRGGALLAVVSTFVECAIGAALILLHMVGSNESFARGLWLAAHLVNTLFLLAALSATAWQSTAIRERAVRWPQPRRILVLTIGGFLAAGILGTFAALGDTLTVSTSLAASFRADFSAFSNVFVRLRILHPVVAGAVGLWLIAVAFRGTASKRLGGTIAALVCCQFALGMADIALKTPIWLQLMHLLGADLLWIVFVLWAAERVLISE
jgi:cytochrome c oxidase assembly protein subunit 15